MSIIATYNFDDQTVGTSVGWTSISGSAYAVTTNNPISGTKAFGPATHGTSKIAVLTSQTAIADGCYQWSQRANQNGSFAGPVIGGILRSNDTATDGYYFLVLLGVNNTTFGNLIVFKKVAGAYTSLNGALGSSSFLGIVDGDIVHTKIEAEGTSLRWKMWINDQAEPAWRETIVDSSITAAGKFGLYEGNNFGGAGTGVASADDIFIGTVGQTFDGPLDITNYIAPDDSAIYWSPGTWNTSSSASIAINPGAYLKTRFSGTACGIAVDLTAFDALGRAASKYPRILYSVDGGEWLPALLEAGQSIVPLATGLADTTHTLTVLFRASDSYSARWNATNALKITAILTNVGATLSSPTLRTKRMLVFGDSITEGAWALGPPGAEADYSNYSLYGDSLSSYARHLAVALDAELGHIGFGGQSWGSTFNGDVPALPSSWSSIYSGVSRLSVGLLSPQPDYIFCNMGANSGVAGASTVTDWITAVRAAAPSATIYIVVPFGGTGRTNITTGVTNYLTANPADPNVTLIDIGTVEGITASSGSPTVNATDGLHPNTFGHAAVAAAIMQSIGEAAGDVTSSEVSGLTTDALTQITTAVRIELATELARIDAAISSRNATAPDNAGIAAIQAKTSNLPASPAATGEIPSAGTNAAAVRTNLATELAEILKIPRKGQTMRWTNAGTGVGYDDIQMGDVP